MANSTSTGTSGFPIQPVDFSLGDLQRAREFYHYLQPDNLIHPDSRRPDSLFDLASDDVPSLSDALAPFCQLAVLRCDCRKAMLNVMDRDLMYFLAEATKESKGKGDTTYEFVEDPILTRCSSVPLKGKICELTIKSQSAEGSQPTPMFVIPDLSQSDFSEMEIVTGPPYYRFYAGVPITTREGINIGSLAVMDTRPRPDGLTDDEVKFMANSARQIMQHLEINRQAIEGMRCRRLAEGLEAFIAGKKTIQLFAHQVERSIKRRSKMLNGSEPPNVDGMRERPSSSEYRWAAQRITSWNSLGDNDSTSGHSSDSDDGWAKVEDDAESRSHIKTFGRAANILRESFGDIGEDGAVTFLSLNPTAEKTPVRGQRRRSIPFLPASKNAHQKPPSDGEKASAIPQTTASRPCFIAYSTQTEPYLPEKEVAHVRGIDDEMLQSLMRRYPGGKLWSLDINNVSSSEEDRTVPNSPLRPRKKSRRKQLEMDALRKEFPSALQVLFAPLWDASSGSFAHACFVATTLDTRSFSSTVELPFLNSFCSTLMAECSRLDTMVADKQKSDFVGTISHEMRSPLHGLLASVEFLTETDLTGFQRSLVDTIDSCGRTLLDTINHVLDFSKVNSFQRVWQASNKKSHSSKRNNFLGPENSSKPLSHGAPPLLQLFGVTDVSAVLEEVVDGLVLGHTYNSGIDITDISRHARGRGTRLGKQDGLGPDTVDILIDVQQADWNFLTQPGAIRRIIMNITGNAIKYTSQGSIHVQLQLKSSTEDDGNDLMVFTVMDTGKGISQEFLSSKLFVPFAQENSLAPGTGLGMSIVRSIVLMLGGTINVKSKVDQGTTVEVSLPMKRPLPGQTSTQTTPWSGGTVSSTASGGDDSITFLHANSANVTMTFYQPVPNVDVELSQVIKSYVQEWYNLDFVDSVLYKTCTVVLVREEHLEKLIEDTMGTPGNRPALIVMCSVSSKHSAALLHSLEQRIASVVEFVSTPCGPHKLARSIRIALDKKQAQNPQFAAPSQSAPPPASPATTRTALESVTEELRDMDLNPPGQNDKAKVVQATETFAASQASQNAQMALHEPITALRTPRTHVSEGDSFPFPIQTQDASRVRRERNRSMSGNGLSQNTPSNGTTPLEAPRPSHLLTELKPERIDPHVLLVDDNKINLRLLETYLRTKRKYTRICQAEDGEQAVDAVRQAQVPFDVIFMDISMPVMNGFDATRAIRQFEDSRSNGGSSDPGAMIIALTGLASGKDQTEVFDSGCDIYMTKPVSFKEVGKLLDHWEKHQSLAVDVDGITGGLGQSH
ncbi:uncharacterized protein PV06_07890 [Exophiala oligosperma]|uniref:Histidine kinase n=1 Tax=Exophiala oligosperma TaxID=215243 RepID=A0A0D2DC79_9EURO|nr:uncharacterized protein PV06_07890 [Exophiala oligosperma]KIW40713.1 hypothetical protein PV06_07890 [Exophiala oligosperma]